MKYVPCNDPEPLDHSIIKLTKAEKARLLLDANACLFASNIITASLQSIKYLTPLRRYVHLGFNSLSILSSVLETEPGKVDIKRRELGIARSAGVHYNH